MAENRENCLCKTVGQALRSFRYLRLPPKDRERVHLARERIKCGKLSCRCAHGLRHGPYVYLRFRYWDAVACRDRYAREYARWIGSDRREICEEWRLHFAYGRVSQRATACGCALSRRGLPMHYSV